VYICGQLPPTSEELAASMFKAFLRVLTPRFTLKMGTKCSCEKVANYLPIKEMFRRLHKPIVHLLCVYIGKVINVVFQYEMEINIFSQDQL